MSKTNMVVLNDVSHYYSAKDDYALKKLSLTVPENEVLGLLGSNGAGKSTMMNIVCGVINQSEGQVLINGIDIKKDPIASKKLIGFLPQKPPLYPELNVEEYLKYSAELRLIPKKEIKTAMERAIDACGLQSYRKRLISKLSGGYQQRVGIAQAIIHKPQIVILDEPTTGLDPNQIIEIHELIRQIAKECTVILSTHILTEVQAICDNIKMIELGELVFEGSIAEFNNYIEPKTIRVSLSTPPMEEKLMALEGISKVEMISANTFRLHYLEYSESIAHHIVDQAVKHKWGLHELSTERESLNQVFAELSRTSSNDQQ